MHSRHNWNHKNVCYPQGGKVTNLKYSNYCNYDKAFFMSWEHQNWVKLFQLPQIFLRNMDLLNISVQFSPQTILLFTWIVFKEPYYIYFECFKPVLFCITADHFPKNTTLFEFFECSIHFCIYAETWHDAIALCECSAEVSNQSSLQLPYRTKII